MANAFVSLPLALLLALTASARAQPERAGLAAVLGHLVSSCAQQADELRRWPLDEVAEVARPDERQRARLADLRSVAATAADRLAAECPRDIPVGLPQRLHAVTRALGIVAGALDALRPSLAGFYATLEDEQKARLLLHSSAAEDGTRRRYWRRERNADGSLSIIRTTAPAPGALCEQLTAALREWPVQGMEREARLSEAQRTKLAALAAAALGAADALVCPAESALTPVGRLDIMRARVAAIRATIAAVQPALESFFEMLDLAQQQRLAQM
jgi:hypothetical protein